MKNVKVVNNLGKKYSRGVFAGVVVATFSASLIYYQNSAQADIVTNENTPVESKQSDTSTTQNNVVLGKINVVESTSSTSSIENNTESSNVNASATISNNEGADAKNEILQDSTTLRDTEKLAQRSVAAASSLNQGSLDKLSIEGTELKVSGWHATDYSKNGDYSFIIVYDATNNHEITRSKIISSPRTDVAKMFNNLVASRILCK